MLINKCANGAAQTQNIFWKNEYFFKSMSPISSTYPYTLYPSPSSHPHPSLSHPTAWSAYPTQCTDQLSTTTPTHLLDLNFPTNCMARYSLYTIPTPPQILFSYILHNWTKVQTYKVCMSSTYNICIWSTYKVCMSSIYNICMTVWMTAYDMTQVLHWLKQITGPSWKTNFKWT